MSLADIHRGVTAVKVTAGDSVLFWKDLWSTEILCASHPRAFSFAVKEDICVRNLMLSSALGQVFHLPLSVEARE